MKRSKLLLIIMTSLFIFSCGVPQTAERKPVPPQGSEESDMPWNRPQAGEGGGALGGMLNQGR